MHHLGRVRVRVRVRVKVKVRVRVRVRVRVTVKVRVRVRVRMSLDSTPSTLLASKCFSVTATCANLFSLPSPIR